MKKVKRWIVQEVCQHFSTRKYSTEGSKVAGKIAKNKAKLNNNKNDGIAYHKLFYFMNLIKFPIFKEAQHDSGDLQANEWSLQVYQQL